MRGALEVGFGDGLLPVPDDPFRLDVLESAAAGTEHGARGHPTRPSRGDGFARAFDRPLGTPPLAQLLRGARSVLVAVSDSTRATGAAEFLPHLLDRIESAAKGCTVRFIVASGIHRRPTDDEITRIVGADLARRHEMLRHDPDDAAALVELGRTSAGTVVRVNRAVRDHDRVVLTGSVGFHYYAGFSGGRKAVVPGLAARETIARNHLRALRPDGSRHPLARAGCLRGNPVHRDMAEGAALVAPSLIVNSILDDRGAIERLYVGHWRRAHEAACRRVRAARCVRVEPRSLVVASAGGDPGDINLIQAHKTFESAMGALLPGGVMVLVARCAEGAGHPEFLPWFEHATEGELVQALQARFQVYGQTALAWLRKAAACRLILVSSLPDDLVRKLRAEPARDVRHAFELARKTIPATTAGWILPHGSRLLVEARERTGSGDRSKRVA